MTDAQTDERPRGRPAAGDGDLREAILDSAERLFADHGADAVPLRRVASDAGVNPALIHYYFDDKHGLLVAVLERTLEPMAGALARIGRDGPPDLDDLLSVMLGMAAEHPNLPRLVTREVMLGDGPLRDHFIENMAPRLGGALPGLIRAGQAAGRIRQDIDPARLAVLLMGLVLFPFVARSVVEPVLDLKLDAEGAAGLRAEIDQLLNHGVRP